SRLLKKLNSKQLEVAIDENSTCTTRELSKTLHVSRHMTIHREMKKLKDKVSKTIKYPLPSTHDLSGINKEQYMACCVSLHSHELQAPF
ncbi:unnamed protein product, partial [Hymenolepis diminuta]